MSTGGITFAGLGSGTDFSAMVDELRKIEEFKIDRYNKEAAEYETKIEALDVIVKKMQELQDITDDLSDMDTIMKPTAESTKETAVSAKATSDSVEGTFTVEVKQLASAAITSSKYEFSDPEEKISSTGSGIFSYTYAGEFVSINIDEDTTVEDFVNAINNDADNPGVKASLISTADGYLFQMQGTETGEKNSLSITTVGTKLGDSVQGWGSTNATTGASTTHASGDPLLDGAETEGTFSVKYGDKTIDVKVDSTTDMADIAAKINTEAAGVTASYDSATGKFELVGADKTKNITVSTSGLAIGDGWDTVKTKEDYIPTKLDATDPINPGGGGEFSYTYDGKEYKVNLTDELTMTQFIDKINAKTSGVTASLDADGNFKLVSDGSKKLEINTKGTELNKTTWNEKKASNAEYVLNGFDDQILTSSSNKIENVIEGITLDLKDVTEDEKVTITVGRDSSELVTKVEEFVDVVNEIRGLVKQLTDVDSEGYTVEADTDDEDSKDKEIGSPLTGNTTVNRFLSSFNEMITSPAHGFGDDGGDENVFSVLSQIGLKTVTAGSDTENGLLDIDMEVLEKAIEENAQGVADLLAGEKTETDSENFVVVSQVDTVEPGDYNVHYDVDADGKITSAWIEELDNFGVMFRTDLTVSADNPNSYTMMNSDSGMYGMSIQFSSTALDPGEYRDDTISVIQGKAQEIGSFFKAESRYIEGAEDNGQLTSLMHNYQEIVDGLDKKIEDEIERLDLWEENQRLKYARLDATLGVMQQQMAANMSALGSVSSS